MIEIFNYPKENEKEEDMCLDEDVVLYYEEGHGKYGDIIEEDSTRDSQDKLDTFFEKYPLWSIKDWSCIPFLDKKEVPSFFDHQEVFEIIDENIIYDENDCIIKQDEDYINTHTVVCCHVYIDDDGDITDLRNEAKEWASKYSDISKISIIKDGSWYSDSCCLVIIEQQQKHPSISVYSYYEPAETFLY